MTVTAPDSPAVWTLIRQEGNGSEDLVSNRTRLVGEIKDASKTVLENIVSQLQVAAQASTTKNMPVLFPHGIGLIKVEFNVGLKPLDLAAGLSFTVAGVKDVPDGANANGGSPVLSAGKE